MKVPAVTAFTSNKMIIEKTKLIQYKLNVQDVETQHLGVAASELVGKRGENLVKVHCVRNINLGGSSEHATRTSAMAPSVESYESSITSILDAPK